MDEFIKESELVLNADGSIYHLQLLPEDIADTVILVGDPDRVGTVSAYFDKVEVVKQKREFITHTGYIGSKRISVVSTGIGTDNIDIVLNELDALVNVDLTTRAIKKQKQVLNIIRIGTSGSLHEDIPVDSILYSSYGLGLDSLMQFYEYMGDDETEELLTEIDSQLDVFFINPYLVKAPGSLIDKLAKDQLTGITATCSGFYGPQGRVLRAETLYADLIERLHRIDARGKRITNFEMETAGIYGLAHVLGHEAVSVNAILANRLTHTFSSNPDKIVKQAIEQVLSVITAK